MNNLELTETDREILQSYCSMCRDLSLFLGSGYEIVLHSLENYDHSAIQVINGFHTGRSIGAPITDLGLKMLKKIQVSDSPKEYLCYFSLNSSGKRLKSTTIPVYGEHKRLIGLLCINFYLDTPFTDVLNSFVPGSVQSEAVTQNESHMNSTDELIADSVARVKKAVMEDPNILSINKNKEIVNRLYADGIFNLKNSVIQCANLLGISKNTVYMHIRNLDSH